MDIEFHYYMTYLIAARAGFSAGQAETLAHAAQSVDDNHIKYQITGAPNGGYNNYISQSMNILKPTTQLLRIYPIFHFIPGDPDAPSAQRSDGQQDLWVTTPDSAVARQMIDEALASDDLYRIGVAAHGYVDTWAHQNFVGRRAAFNDMPDGGLVGAFLSVGHGAAGHQPDHPALVWQDRRLSAPDVDNRLRFLDAAEALFRRLARHINNAADDAFLTSEAAILRQHLDADIGPSDPTTDDTLRAARIARYQARALQPAYGGAALPDYDEDAWFNSAVLERDATLRQRADRLLGMMADYVDQSDALPCAWRDPATYSQSDWFRFVEAVKAHQNACWALLESEGLPGLDAPGM
ncbi:DUF6765 family protein [Phenylobacterium sp.]|uniref:DUF6765 family protein n=1 Tax=Phenylobacterium sp. TaxID=1871053 RepID=UPI002BFB0735|nr:DUF6765 family protein [Phenylobacterium sp.]HLZ77187.1 DUF6765 family protein [Phenylobacterium sp.]